MRFWSRYTVCSALCQSNATQSTIGVSSFARVSLLILTPLRSDSRAHVSISQAYFFTGHSLFGQIVANMRHPVGTFLTFDQVIKLPHTGYPVPSVRFAPYAGFCFPPWPL